MNYLDINEFVDEIVQPIILENVLDYLYDECDSNSFDNIDEVECFAEETCPPSLYDKICSEITMYIENNTKYDFTKVTEHNLDEQILEMLINNTWELEKQKHIDKLLPTFNRYSDDYGYDYDMYDMYDY